MSEYSCYPIVPEDESVRNAYSTARIEIEFSERIERIEQSLSEALNIADDLRADVVIEIKRIFDSNMDFGQVQEVQKYLHHLTQPLGRLISYLEYQRESIKGL